MTTPTKTLGPQGPTLPALGLGCMGMSDFYGSAQSRDDQESIATIQAALDAGLSFLDTGDFYGNGHNELLVGQAIRGRREQAFLSVKFGILRDPMGGFNGIDGRPQAVKNFCAYSLKRLGVDHIDLYQPARLDPAVPLEDTVGAIAELVKAGKVRYLGLSEAGAEAAVRASKVHPVAAVQVEYSLATRVVEKELAGLRANGTGVVAYGALSRGLLSGADEPLAPTDFRAHLPRFSSQNRAQNAGKLALLKEIAGGYGATAAQVALAWVLGRGANILTLIGTTKRARLAENVKALELKIGEGDLQRLDEVFAVGAIAGERYPEGQMGLVLR